MNTNTTDTTETTRKVYACQIPSEEQESPLFLHEELFPDDIAVFGNRYYKKHCPEIIEKVWNVLNECELANYLEHPKELKQWWKNKTECIMEYLPPQHKEKYSTQEINKLNNLVLDHYNKTAVSSEKQKIFCKILSIVTGKTWNYKAIHGSCQSDWNYVYYPDTWTKEMIDEFEIEYFNTGSEWMIHDEANIPDCAEDISGHTIYCHGWNIDMIRKEIAEAEGVNPEDIILYEFSGYSRIANYNLVS